MITVSQSTNSTGARLTSRVASLQEAATRIRSLGRNVSASIVEIGRELLKVKDDIAHGTFTLWVENDCGLTRRTAQNYMRVALFVADKSASIALLSPAVLYRLAAKSTPAWIVTAVISLLESGLVPTEAQVDQLFASYSSQEAPLPEPEISNPSQLASELLFSIGHARCQELLKCWKLVGTNLRHQLGQESVDRDLTARDTAEPDFGPAVTFVRDPTDENLFHVKPSGGDREELAPNDELVACHFTRPIVSQVESQTDEPTLADEAANDAMAVQPDFMADSEGPLNGIPDFLRYKKGRCSGQSRDVFRPTSSDDLEAKSGV